MPFIYNENRVFDTDRDLELWLGSYSGSDKHFQFHRVGKPDEMVSEQVFYEYCRMKISDIELTMEEKRQLPAKIEWICSYNIGRIVKFANPMGGPKTSPVFDFADFIDGYSADEAKQVIVEAFMAREYRKDIHKISHYDFYFTPDEAPKGRTI